MKKYLVFLIVVSAFWSCDKKSETVNVEPVKPAVEPVEAKKTDTPKTEPSKTTASKPVEKKAAALPPNIEAGEKKVFGAPFAITSEPIALSDATKNWKKNGEKPQKVKAKIGKVCKKKGCWFTLSDEKIATEIRVKMKDYGFFVPRNADGTDVVVEGMLTTREMPIEEAQHYADDAVEGTDKKPEKVTAPKQVFEFTATTVEIAKS